MPRYGEAEDVWSVVRERDTLRRKVRKLEAEVRHWRTIAEGRRGSVRLKPDDRQAPTLPPRLPDRPTPETQP